MSSKILAKVIEYCKYHVAAKKENESEQKVKEFNSAFVKVDQATLFEIILAANYLNMSGLLDDLLSIRYVAIRRCTKRLDLAQRRRRYSLTHSS